MRRSGLTTRASLRGDRLGGLQHPIDRRPADSERLCDLRGAEPLRLHCTHLGGVHRRAALVDAGSLGLRDPFQLALAAVLAGPASTIASPSG